MMVAGLSTDDASVGSDKGLIANETRAPSPFAAFHATLAGP